MPGRLRVYTSPSAFPNPQRLRLFLYEKGISGEVEEVIYGPRAASNADGPTSR